MRIDEELKLSGYFWLPSNRDKKVAGTLYIKNGGEIELEIIGHFSDGYPKSNADDIDFERIIGDVEKLSLVTLENCFYVQKNYSFNNGISKSKINVNVAFSGVEYEQDEVITFDSFNFSIDGLEEWVGISGISIEYDDDYMAAKIRVSQPDFLSYKLNNGLSLEISFGHSMPIKSYPINLNVSQNTFFKVISKKSLNIDEVIFYLHKFVTFLNFAIDENVSLKSVYCFSNSFAREVNGIDRPEPIGVYYSSIPFEKEVPKIEQRTMLFRFIDVKQRFDVIIGKWLDVYEVFTPSLNLYFSTKSGAQKYLEGKFLVLAQALETYHRRTSNETYISKEEFKNLLYEIKSKCPKEHKNWLAGRLDNGNEISLRNRLNRITESFKSIIGSDDEVKLIIGLIVDTRNYLTHYSPKLEKKAASVKNLWNLCQKMEAILQLHLLKELGFNDEEINSVLNNTYKFKNKLQSTSISTN